MMRKKIILILFVGSILSPLFNGRYVFFSDQVFGPGWDPLAVLYGVEVPHNGALPLYLVLYGVKQVVGMAVAQKLLLAVVVAGAGFSAYYVFRQGYRLYAAVLFLVNPFVYVRLVAGQWLVLWGYMLLPVVLYAYTRYLERGGRLWFAAVVGSVAVLAFSPHTLFMAGILLGAVTVSRAVAERDTRVLVRAVTPVPAVLVVGAYWLVPFVLSGGGKVARIGAGDLSVFAPQGDVVSALYSVASMHGFWRDGFVYATDMVPGAEYLFVPVLFLAVHGFVAHYNDDDVGYVVRALGAVWVVAVVLAAGVHGPFPGLYEFLFEHVPLFRGMRDSQKFVALIALCYAYLGGLGLQDVVENTRSRWSFQVRGGSVPHLVVTAVAIGIIMVYTLPMVTGFAGQLQPQDYPAEWYEAKQVVDEADGRVLFLPWHMYMDMSWLEQDQQRVGNPAEAFFDVPVLRGQNIEVGPIYTNADDPDARYVRTLFGLGPGNERANVTDFGRRLTEIGVSHVVVAKEADWQEYRPFLQRQGDLRLVLENDRMLVYRNTQPVEWEQSFRFASGVLPAYVVSAVAVIGLVVVVYGRRLKNAGVQRYREVVA